MRELLHFIHQYQMLAALSVVFVAVCSFVGGLFFRSKFGATLYSIYEQAMTQPEVNSRLVFLAYGLASTVGILALCIGFLFASDRSNFPLMVGTVGGGGFGAALGRYFTKAGDGKQDDQPPPPQPVPQQPTGPAQP